MEIAEEGNEIFKGQYASILVEIGRAYNLQENIKKAKKHFNVALLSSTNDAHSGKASRSNANCGLNNCHYFEKIGRLFDMFKGDKECVTL